MLSRNIASDQRPAAERVWRAVERRTASTALTCSWDWTETWLAHYGDVVPHRFVVGVVDGEDRGIALVTESADRYPPWVGLRQAHVGTAGEPAGEGVYVERNRLLVADGDRDAFAAVLLANLVRDRRWDRLVIPGLHVADAESFRRASPRLVLAPQESPIAELTGAGSGDPLELLSARPRRRARRALEGLAPLETEWAQTSAQGHDVMSELVALHQRRWIEAGEPGKFASARFARFHRALIDRLGPGRGVILVRVRRDGETIGCVYGLVEDREVLFYQSGLRRYEDNKLNVGLAVHVCAMRACVEHGLRAYDFLAPATRYKQDLSTRANTLVWASLGRNRPRTYLDTALRELRSRLPATARGAASGRGVNGTAPRA